MGSRALPDGGMKKTGQSLLLTKRLKAGVGECSEIGRKMSDAEPGSKAESGIKRGDDRASVECGGGSGGLREIGEQPASGGHSPAGDS